MALLTEELRGFIGLAGEPYAACCPVERSEVRRYTQAVMDDDPVFHADDTPYGGPVAPALFPTLMVRRDFGTPDLVAERAGDPDYDGSDTFLQRVPPLPLQRMSLLNGGSEIEVLRYARHGERVTAQSRYADIFEKETSKGPMLFVVMETEYRGEDGSVLLRNRQTVIRRPL